MGYVFGRDSTAYGITNIGPNPLFTSSNPSGVLGSGHVGYDISTQALPLLARFSGAGGVVGIEGDVDGTDFHKTITNPVFGGPSASVKSDIQGSIRGWLGFAVDRLLIYATGGAAFADFKDTTTVNVLGTDAARHSRLGWTVGRLGICLRAAAVPPPEYRYSDFARYSENLANSTLQAFDARHHETIQRVEVGLSYHFETPVAVPVVARY